MDSFHLLMLAMAISYVEAKPERIRVDKSNNVYLWIPDILEIWVMKNVFKDRVPFLNFDDFEGNVPTTVGISDRLGCLYVGYNDELTIDCFQLEK